MKRKTVLLLILLTILSIFFAKFTSATPSAEMTFGGMNEILPEKEFAQYFKLAFPEMKKIHGEPFSAFTFTIEGRSDLAEGGWFPIEKKVVLSAEPMEAYQDFINEKAEGGKAASIRSIEQGSTHELAHAMYTYGNTAIGFPAAVANEGWAKTVELITWMRIKGIPPRPGIYLTQYVDKDTLAGTHALGSYKQKKNHTLIYDELSVASLNLLYGCSDSNSDPDFQIRMDNEIYENYIANKKPLFMDKIIPEDDYSNLIKRFCEGRKIDGQDAYEWYFSQPAAFTEGSTGFHLGVYPHWWVYTTVEGIDVYTFDRIQNTKDQDKSEIGLSATVTIEVFDVNGNSVFNKTTQTDAVGNSFINFGRDFLKNGAYYVIAKATNQGRVYQSKIFFFNIRDEDGSFDEQNKAAMQQLNGVIGIMVDKNLTPLSSKYLAVLKPLGNAKITQNANGVIFAEVSNPETKEITFDFLGQNFTYTKPPFRRLIVFQVSDDLLKKAESRPEFKNFTDAGLLNNSGKQNQPGGHPQQNLVNDRLAQPNSIDLGKVAVAVLITLVIIVIVGAVYMMAINKKRKIAENQKKETEKKKPERGDQK